MTNILTAAEAATVLRCEEADANMLDLLSLVDIYLENATGRDWTADASVEPTAKAAARMLLVRWHEDPGGMAAGNALGFGLSAALTQLKAKALELARSGVPAYGLALLSTNLRGEMAVDASLTLIFNHEMSATATANVSLEDARGNTIATTNSLSATGKILTIAPNADLTAASAYTIVLDHPADVYGQTLDDYLSFWTQD